MGKLFKRIVCLTLCAVMCLTALPLTALAADTSGSSEAARDRAEPQKTLKEER